VAAVAGTLGRRCNDAFGDFALEHQCQAVEPGGPWLGFEPSCQQERGDVVRKVSDDARGGGRRSGASRGDELGRIDGEGVPGDDLESIRIDVGDLGERGEAACITFDGNDATGPFKEQGARQPAGAGTDLDHSDVFERTGSACDASRQVEVEQKILAERSLGLQSMPPYDLPQRWQPIAHADDVPAGSDPGRGSLLRHETVRNGIGRDRLSGLDGAERAQGQLKEHGVVARSETVGVVVAG